MILGQSRRLRRDTASFREFKPLPAEGGLRLLGILRWPGRIWAGHASHRMARPRNCGPRFLRGRASLRRRSVLLPAGSRQPACRRLGAGSARWCGGSAEALGGPERYGLGLGWRKGRRSCGPRSWPTGSGLNSATVSRLGHLGGSWIPGLDGRPVRLAELGPTHPAEAESLPPRARNNGGSRRPDWRAADGTARSGTHLSGRLEGASRLLARRWWRASSRPILE